MTPRTRGAVVWAAWATAFVVAETVAVRRNDNTALCHYLRPALGVHGHPVHKAAGIGVLAGFAAWFVPHLYKSPRGGDQR